MCEREGEREGGREGVVSGQHAVILVLRLFKIKKQLKSSKKLGSSLLLNAMA